MLLGAAKDGTLRSKELSKAVGLKPRRGGALITSLKSSGYLQESGEGVCSACNQKMSAGRVLLTMKGRELLELMTPEKDTT